MKIDAPFRQKLSDPEYQLLNHSADVTYLIDGDFCLRGYNQAWVEFAQANQGQGLLANYTIGRSILDAMPVVLRAYFDASYRAAMNTGEPFELDFLCSSPQKMRKFHQIATQLKNQKGLLIQNRLLLEQDHKVEPVLLSPQHVNAEGFIVQCAHCRNVKNQMTSSWEWVPDAVAHPLNNISHGICPACLQEFYPDYI